MVYHVTNFFPTAFEYNVKYLIWLYDWVRLHFLAFLLFLSNLMFFS